MKRAGFGYTIVEVMIVLAISGTILASAIALFRGQRGETEFSQSMQDIASKIQFYVHGVGTDRELVTDQYTCILRGERPHLQDIQREQGTSQDCLFLGKAIQVEPDSSKIFIYSVLGRRTKPIGGSGKREPVTTYEEANPTPIIDEIPDGADLTEEYNLATGAAIVKWAEVLNGGNPKTSHLAGFYSGLQDQYQSSDKLSVLSRAYDFRTQGDIRQGIRRCIQGEPACVSYQLDTWAICFASTANSQTALLSVISTPTGVNTDLDFQECN